MSAVAYFRESMDFLHGAFAAADSGLTDAQLHFIPPGESHSIAWVLWHAARMEDRFVQRIFQDRPTEWETGGWARRTGLPAAGFGTGQTTAEASAIRIADRAAFAQYAARVAALTDAFLGGLTDDDLAREVRVRAVETVGFAINRHLVTHLNGHRGEVNLLRGMLGFAPVLPDQGG